MKFLFRDRKVALKLLRPVIGAERFLQAIKVTANPRRLHYAPRQGVIHRDMRPENVLLHDGPQPPEVP